MASITKRVNRGIEGNKRYQYWASSETDDAGGAIGTGDVFMIEDSLGRPANTIMIRTTGITSLSIRFNSKMVTYPKRTHEDDGIWPTPDLANPATWYDSSMTAIPISANSVWALDNTLPISDITIVEYTAGSGSFTLFVA